MDLSSEFDVQTIIHDMLDQFIAEFVKITGIDLRTLDALSHRSYESKKCKGTLLFLETENFVRIETGIITNTPIYFCNNQLRRIRKLIAGGEDYALAFSRVNSSNQFTDRFVLKGYTKQVQNDGWKVEISHPGIFTVSVAMQPLFQMNRLRPRPVQIQWHHQLEEVCCVFCIKSDAKRKKLCKLLKQIEKQGHGAAVLFLNLKKNSGAENRIRKLFSLERGYAVTGTPIAAQAVMDGAIVVDVSTCKISYFGVIVDGIARERGDMSRGARHNSLDTFVRDFHAQYQAEPVAAIVFSEDGGSTLYCPRRS